ncbi:ComF family protein [Pseudomonas sp. GX19020]|uniref:ComF family protein n=1 Tax=Pseudomonas sp. GX19020 TaxID=2942277 RepID=UPI00201A097A|nr:ComF family protein [Pseudomonas sp. GX19020]MCL4068505.1 ComF family protein [Pseudomonas sp. GX19020]
MLAKTLGLGLLRAVFPPQCIACGGLVSSDFGLCGGCWRDTPFITGACCSTCGLEVPADPDASGAAGGGDHLCEECHAAPRPWAAGRAAMLYRATGRSLVLALKHGDRLDLARPMGQWLARAARPLLAEGMVIAPVPLHRWRLFRRQYNQAALLSHELARLTGLDHFPDLLTRPRATGSQEGRSREARFAALDGAFRISPRQAAGIRGRPVLLVDDVMTSGATFSAATAACHAAGAGPVSVLALARVARNG